MLAVLPRGSECYVLQATYLSNHLLSFHLWNIDSL